MFIVVQPEIREYNKLYFSNTRESEEQKQKLGKKRGIGGKGSGFEVGLRISKESTIKRNQDKVTRLF